MDRTLAREARPPANISAELAALEAAAILAGLAYTLVTIKALGIVWGRYPRRLPFPSQALIAYYALRSVRTVRRHIAALEAAGLLEVYRNAAHRAANGQWRRKTNAYLLRTRAAKAKTWQNRRSRLGDTRVPINVKTGAAVACPPWFDPPEAGVALLGRHHVAELRAMLAQR